MCAPDDVSSEDKIVTTGITRLDEVLHGGLPQGHFFLVEGAPGTGKTTLGLQFLLEGARRGERVLYITLSESEKEVRKVARSHHWSLDGVTIYEYTPAEESLRPDEQYSVFHPADVEFQDTTQNILGEVERVQPARVVLDSLSEIRLLARDSLRYRRQILALKHYFTNRNCTVLLLDDRTAEAHDLQLQSIAHGVIYLETVPRDYGKSRRRMQVSKMRGSTYREGYHDYSIQTGGVTIWPRLVAANHLTGDFGGTITSGVPALDRLLGCGLDRGTATLFLGPAGSGKSSLALACAVAAARRDEVAAVFLFEELITLACRRGAGLGIDPRPVLDSGKLLMRKTDPAELAPGEFVDLVRHSVEDLDAKVIVIDSLNGLLQAMPNEESLNIQLHEMLAFLNQRGVVTILVLAQAGIVGSPASPVDLSYLADNVVLFRYFEAEGRVRKAVSVVKKRGGPHEDTIRELYMSNGRISMGEPLSAFSGVLSGVPTYTGPARMLEKQHATDE